HPLDILDIPVIAIASDAASASVSRDELGPFVFDMAFDLSCGGRSPPKEAVGELQQGRTIQALRHELRAAYLSRKRPRVAREFGGCRGRKRAEEPLAW